MLSLTSLFCVAAGAFLGGIGRHCLNIAVKSPWSTLCANILGSACAGAAWVLFTHESPVYTFVSAGLAGGLSTWSTLARECGQLLKDGRWVWCAGYVCASISAGVGAAWLLESLM